MSASHHLCPERALMRGRHHSPLCLRRVLPIARDESRERARERDAHIRLMPFTFPSSYAMHIHICSSFVILFALLCAVSRLFGAAELRDDI